jgi:hypothetical protein
MNRRLEMIVTNRDSALRESDAFNNSMNVFQDAGFNTAQIEDMQREKREAFDKANNEFWEAFKHVIEIKDINKGENPKDGETVYVFDDYELDWQKSEFFDNGARRYFTLNLYRCDTERYHFWIKLPTTFEGSY